MRFLPIFLIALVPFVAACSSDKEETPVLEEEKISAEEQYNKAQDGFEKKNYKKAAEDFLEVERNYPYSEWATHAQIQAAYAYYKDEEYNQALGTLERFIKLNPGSESVSYAYYLIARCYYNQISSVERDQEMTVKARKALNDVVQRYPESDYARDAKFKLDLVEDHLAGKEMAVGRYYLERKQYIGAINRFKTVVEDYPTTAQVEEALHRLVEAYLSLGVVPEAQKYAAVLGHNYPGSEWYQDSYDLLINGGGEPAATTTRSDDNNAWYKIW